jgi:hypothetical protein
MAQDWGEVPGRPDDYGYGFYVRVNDFDGDGHDEVLINDRRFAWYYTTSRRLCSLLTQLTHDRL